VGEDIRRIFEQEVREKKLSARGAQKKRGRRGLVGKMLTPADFAGREYRRPGNLSAFNITDLITKLSQAPTLKEVLLSKMDEEYKNYRLATEKTIDAVAEVVRMGFEPLARELGAALDRLDELEAVVAAAGLTEADLPAAGLPAADLPASGLPGTSTPASAGPVARARRTPNGSPRAASAAGAGNPVAAPSARIRWGSTPAEIRSIVARQLQRLNAEGKNIDTKTIRAEVPSMLKWLYGKRAVFDGLEDAKRAAGIGLATASAQASTEFSPPPSAELAAEGASLVVPGSGGISAPACLDAASCGSPAAVGPSLT